MKKVNGFIRLGISSIVLLASACVCAQEQTDDVDPLSQQKSKQSQDIEWGDWGKDKTSIARYGVGIEGEIESELSRLDRSNLLDNAEGVKVQNKLQIQSSKPRDVKKLMEELEAMEAEIKQEINDESEF